jgi:hypothetical protein
LVRWLPIIAARGLASQLGARRSVLGRLPDDRNARANTDERELVLTRPRRHTEPIISASLKM